MNRPYPARSKPSDSTRVCVICGVLFERGPKKTSTITCSTECRRQRQRQREARKQYSKSKPSVQCLTCDVEIRDRKGSGPGRKYCSYACAYARTKDRPLCRPDHCRIYVFPCECCGAANVSRKPRRFCNSLCYDRFYNNQVRQVVEKIRPAWWKEIRSCPRCGCSFEALSENQVCCSKRCRKALEKYRRRVSSDNKNGADRIGMAQLARRDNWTCHLCGGQVNHGKFSGHQLDATIDHLVPVSKGGRHVWSNVKLAHFICNSRRGAQDLIECAGTFAPRQLELFSDWQG